jgi:hypothetical protein
MIESDGRLKKKSDERMNLGTLQEKSPQLAPPQLRDA